MREGDTGEARLTVAEDDTAKAVALTVDDVFPAVLATTRMIALMELAASRAMKGLLAPGQLSVGVGVNVKHLAATPVGAGVRAQATFLGMEGKLYRFRVEAFDPGGPIGNGEHTRAIIDTERLLAGAAARGAG
jgi:predicted thioesterase